MENNELNVMENPTTEEETREALVEQLTELSDQDSYDSEECSEEVGVSALVIGGAIGGLVTLGAGVYFGVKKLVKSGKVKEIQDNAKQHREAMRVRNDLLKEAKKNYKDRVDEIKGKKADPVEELPSAEENKTDSVVENKSSKKK